MNEQLASFVGDAVLNNWLSLSSLAVTFCAGLVALTWFISNLVHKREIRLLELQLAHQKDQFFQFETIVNQRVDALKEQAGLVEDAIENDNRQQDLPNVSKEIMFSKELRVSKEKDSSMSAFLKNTEALSGLLSSIMRVM
ncbi:hypothetical protein [Vibrio europaeus]|uniref:hypothetical protein n=1 Tax=Vibrio europaeus TaxID=300876 RepID=UPI00148C58AD|nr:hypothetical protein [Vibrio europaeus]NOH22545.1 hypothetical protein [Vibrio europaeus]